MICHFTSKRLFLQSTLHRMRDIEMHIKPTRKADISAPTCGESAVGMHGRDKGMQYLRERVQISDFHLTNETNSNHLYHCADTGTANPPSRSRWSGAALTQPAGRSINRPCARAFRGVLLPHWNVFSKWWGEMRTYGDWFNLLIGH